MPAAASVARLLPSAPSVIRSPARRRETVSMACSVATKAPEGRGLYVVLGVGERANMGEIKVAYRTLAKRWHPDVVGEGRAGIFLEIQRAYATLSDPKERELCDNMMGLGLRLGIRRGERLCVKRRWETDQCW